MKSILGFLFVILAAVPALALTARVFPPQTGHSGECLKTDGSGVLWDACGGGGGGSGTVTSITAGTGLTGGTITTAGTIALNSSVSLTTITFPSVDADGALALNTAGSLGGVQINGPRGLTIGGWSGVGGPIKLNDGANSFGIKIKAPNTLGSDFTYTLPSNYGTSGQFLQSNGSGTLVWATASGGGGATTALDNLASVQINSDLIFQSVGDSQFIFQTGNNTDADAVVTDDLIIKTGAKTEGTAKSGNVHVSTGGSAGGRGYVAIEGSYARLTGSRLEIDGGNPYTIKTADSDVTNDVTQQLTVQSGDGSPDGKDSGPTILTSGDSGDVATGAVAVKSHDGTGDIQSGNAVLKSGDVAGNNASGNVDISSGNTTGGGGTGSVSVRAGTGGGGTRGDLILEGRLASLSGDFGAEINGGNLGVSLQAGGTNRKIELNGHIVSSGGGTPSATVDANAGTGATCTLASETDTKGEIILTTGSVATPASGAQCGLQFGNEYANAPVCTFSALDQDAAVAASLIYLTQTTTDLVFNARTALVNNTEYRWAYHCIE